MSLAQFPIQISDMNDIGPLNVDVERGAMEIIVIKGLVMSLAYNFPQPTRRFTSCFLIRDVRRNCPQARFTYGKLR